MKNIRFQSPRGAQQELQLISEQNPLEYSVPVANVDIPDQSATLYVTQGAHQSYGLTPLVPDVNRDTNVLEKHKAGKFTTNVVLLSPYEYSKAYQMDIRYTDSYEPHGQHYSSATISKDGITLVLAAMRDKREYTHDSLKAEAQRFHCNVEDLDDLKRKSDGVPISDILRQESSQLIIDDLRRALYRDVATAIEKSYALHDPRNTARRIGELSTVLTLETGLLLAVSSIPDVEPMVQLAGSSAIAGISLALIYKANRIMRSYSGNTPLRLRNNIINARDYALDISDQFTAVYSTQMFDQEFEEALNPDQE